MIAVQRCLAPADSLAPLIVVEREERPVRSLQLVPEAATSLSPLYASILGSGKMLLRAHSGPRTGFSLSVHRQLWTPRCSFGRKRHAILCIRSAVPEAPGPILILLPLSTMFQLFTSDHGNLDAVAATAIALAILLILRRNRVHNKLPPGPPLDPIIGGLRIMPSEYQWNTFSDWAKQWGPCALRLNPFAWRS